MPHPIPSLIRGRAGSFLAVAAGVWILIGSPVPVGAYDLNTLDRHLDTQQQNRIQDHQNHMRSQQRPNQPRPKGQRPRAEQRPFRCSADALSQGERRELIAKGREIERRYGKAAAEEYGRRKGREFYQRLKRQGVCS